MKRWITLVVLCVTIATIVGMASCGGNGGGGPDGSDDGTISDGNPFSDGGAGDGGCGWNGCGDGQSTCESLGFSCKVNTDCCSGNCLGGSCQPPPCTSDNQACTTNAQCCGGTCGTNGTCTPLNNSCETLGNSCTSGNQCCSMFCDMGICGQPSYCGQNGDICAVGADCCGGICTIQSGHVFGTCGQPPGSGAQCKAIDGVVCSSTTNGDAGFLDSGLPACGGACCSRDCAPWGPTQVLICQPASGCKPVGDICYGDDDCCGGGGGGKKDASVTSCNGAVDGGPGVCSNPTGCKPNGDICRLQTNECNATDDCCSGNVQQDDTCKQDNLGVPRCSYPGDGGCIPIEAGTQCASSADCCNLESVRPRR